MLDQLGRGDAGEKVAQEDYRMQDEKGREAGEIFFHNLNYL